MPASDTVTTFALMSLALIVVPGPSVAFVVSRGVAYGRRAALATVAGNAVGAYVQVIAVAAGLGAVFARSVTAFTTIKLVGAAYLLWIGVQTIRHRHSGADVDSSRSSPPPRSLRGLVIDGFVVGASNPKSMVFFAAILPSSSAAMVQAGVPRWLSSGWCSSPSPWCATASGASRPERPGPGFTGRPVCRPNWRSAAAG